MATMARLSKVAREIWALWYADQPVAARPPSTRVAKRATWPIVVSMGASYPRKGPLSSPSVYDGGLSLAVEEPSVRVILNQDVKDLGKAGALIEVSEGHARNFLFPRKLAKEATPGAIKEWEAGQEAIKRREARQLADAQAAAERLKDVVVTLKSKAGENGKLYGTITTKEVAAAIKSQLNVDADKRKIELTEAIKSLGVYPFTLKLHTNVSVQMKASVLIED